MQSYAINVFKPYLCCVILRFILFAIICLSSVSACLADKLPNIETLQSRSELDDYYSNVILGFNIIKETEIYASRFVGNQLNCTSCHRNAGTSQGQLPLNIAGVYPLWRSKNAQIADLSLLIRECFVYSLNGVMPPANAPEVIAIKTYISYLSHKQLIGLSPLGRGVSTLPESSYEPNPVNGQIVYQQHCTACHGDNGKGVLDTPPVWGADSYSKGSGMNDIKLSASFIKIKMTDISKSRLSVQQAFDVAAYLNKKPRPVDPGKRKLPKLFEDIVGFFKERTL